MTALSFRESQTSGLTLENLRLKMAPPSTYIKFNLQTIKVGFGSHLTQMIGRAMEER
jgi:hypothetical protein